MLTWLVNGILTPLKVGFQLVPTLFGWFFIAVCKLVSLVWYLVNLIGVCAYWLLYQVYNLLWVIIKYPIGFTLRSIAQLVVDTV